MYMVMLFTQSNIYNLRELTEPRCLSSIPFGGRFRMIDFMLSNLVNAGVSDVGVLLLAKYKSLLDHLGSGKDWDLARHSGGLPSAAPLLPVQRGKPPGVPRAYGHPVRDYALLTGHPAGICAHRRWATSP